MNLRMLFVLLLPAVLIACDGNDPLQPAAGAGEALTAEKGTAMNLGVPAETRAEVIRFSDMEVVEGARAGLLREADAVRTRTHTTELPHRDVVTLWWVIFNNPEECEHGAGQMACGEMDLFDGPDGPTGVEPSCVYADGSIVGKNRTARYHDRLTMGEVRDSCIDHFVGAFEEVEGKDYGLTNPAGAEIHLVMRSHGPLIPGRVPEQRSTFAGGCEEFLPPGVEELAPGECSDLQFAVFLAPDS